MDMPQPGASDAEWTRLHLVPGADGPEVVHARYVRHSFARHAHEELVVGLIEQGAQAFTCRGARHVTPAGQIFFVNPQEGHTGEAALPSGYVYRTFYPSTALVARVAEELCGRAAPLPFLPSVARDRALAARLAAFHRAV